MLSVVYAVVVCLSVCPSVCLCVCNTCVSCHTPVLYQTAKRRITQILCHTLVYTDKRVVQSLCHSRASCFIKAACWMQHRRLKNHLLWLYTKRWEIGSRHVLKLSTARRSSSSWALWRRASSTATTTSCPWVSSARRRRQRQCPAPPPCTRRTRRVIDSLSKTLLT